MLKHYFLRLADLITDALPGPLLPAWVALLAAVGGRRRSGAIDAEIDLIRRAWTGARDDAIRRFADREKGHLGEFDAKVADLNAAGTGELSVEEHLKASEIGSGPWWDRYLDRLIGEHVRDPKRVPDPLASTPATFAKVDENRWKLAVPELDRLSQPVDEAAGEVGSRPPRSRPHRSDEGTREGGDLEDARRSFAAGLEDAAAQADAARDRAVDAAKQELVVARQRAASQLSSAADRAAGDFPGGVFNG